MSETSLKVRIETRERLKRLIRPGQTVDDFLSAILPKTEDFVEYDNLRDALTQKAFKNALDEGQELWRDAAEKTKRRLSEG